MIPRILPTLKRRRFLQVGLAGSFLAGTAIGPSPTLAAPAAGDLLIRKIDRVTVKVPYRPTPARHMARELPHWQYVEIFTVELQSGHKGYGETLLYYTWKATGDEDVQRAEGQNAAKIMWDDTLGAGLQMALFDAVARAADVPIHSLLGTQVHAKTPLSWWNIDTSAADMAAECKEAHRLGYRAYKTKGRPWFDVWKQVSEATQGLPASFKIDMDFNDTLLDAKRAIPILKDLEKYPHIAIYETPIFQNDVGGNQEIRKATRVAIAMHYGDPEPLIALKQEVCDGFVIGGGATRVLHRGSVAAMAELPFWLQLVGTGITAAFSLHFGAVSSHARWPAVNCHQLYQHTLLTKPIEVREGFAQIPQGPGLGYDLDWDTIEKLRVDKPPRRPEPARLLETSWPDGKRMYVGNTGRVNFMLDVGRQGKIPFYKRGATTRLVPDDGTAKWQELYKKARLGPVMQ